MERQSLEYEGYFVFLHLYPPRNGSLVLLQAGVTPGLTQPQTYADMPQTLVTLRRSVWFTVCHSREGLVTGVEQVATPPPQSISRKRWVLVFSWLLPLIPLI